MGNTYKYGSAGDMDIGLGTGAKVMTLPFTTTISEVDTTWDLPARTIVLYTVIETTTAVAATTMDVGYLGGTGAELSDDTPVSSTGWIDGSETTPTLVGDSAKSITYTGSDVDAEGYIHITYMQL